MVDDTTIDYSVVVKIKCTRFDVFGGIMGVSYLYLPLKAMPLSNIKMSVDIVKKTAPPKSITSFQFDITNYGNYREMFGFRVEGEEGLISHVDTQTIVLDPKETKKVDLKVFTPPTLLDLGTPRRIYIYAYSYETNTSIPLGSVTVVTQGVYIHPLIGITIFSIVVLLIIIHFSYRYIDKIICEVYGKPIKPWFIPEERSYLKKLKKDKPDEYHKVLDMMRQEYQSAMLWYKSSVKNRESILGETSKAVRKIWFYLSSKSRELRSRIKRSKEKLEEDKKTIEKNAKRGRGEKPLKQMRDKEKTIDEKIRENKELRKKKILKKIKKQQEKQCRRLYSQKLETKGI